MAIEQPQVIPPEASVCAGNSAGTLSVPEMHKLICEQEVKHDLLQYEVDGWSIWTFLRPRVGGTLMSGPSSPSRISLSRRAIFSLSDLPELIFARHRRFVAKTCTSGLLEYENGRYKDIWFDDLIKELGPCCKLESINNVRFLPRRRKAMFKSAMTVTFLESLAAGLTLLLKSKEIDQTAAILSEKLRSSFKPELFSPSWVRRRLLYFHWLYKMYQWYLKRVNPEFVLVADPCEYPITAAAKNLRIPVFELQHGLSDRHHPAYVWTEYAHKYKSRMPVPDRLFLYGDHWKKEIDQAGFWGNSLRVVGSPRIDQYRRQCKSLSSESISVSIVLTTQGIATAALIEFIAKFVESANKRLQFRLTIKLHPVFDPSAQPYERVFKRFSNVDILSAQQGASTFELLARATLHLSIMSTCHYDALALGVPTVILALPTHEVVLPLYEAGHALLARTPDELVDIAATCKQRRVSESIQTYYFKAGALKNIQYEIQTALAEK